MASTRHDRSGPDDQAYADYTLAECFGYRFQAEEYRHSRYHVAIGTMSRLAAIIHLAAQFPPFHSQVADPLNVLNIQWCQTFSGSVAD